MGDKITARKKMLSANVPVVPGTTEPIADIKEAIEYINNIGLPVMIKATAGGGGKGMRLVTKEKILFRQLHQQNQKLLHLFLMGMFILRNILAPHII